MSTAMAPPGAGNLFFLLIGGFHTRLLGNIHA